MKVLNIFLSCLLLTPILSHEIYLEAWNVKYFAGSYTFRETGQMQYRLNITVDDADNDNRKDAIFVRFYYQRDGKSVNSKDYIIIQGDDTGIMDRAIRNNNNNKSSQDHNWLQEIRKYVRQIDADSILYSSIITYPDHVQTIDNIAQIDPFVQNFEYGVKFYYKTYANNINGYAYININMKDGKLICYEKAKVKPEEVISVNGGLNLDVITKLLKNKFRFGGNNANNSQMNDDPNDQQDKDQTDAYLLSTGDAKPKDKSKSQSQGSGSMRSKLSSAKDTMKKALSFGNKDKDKDDDNGTNYSKMQGRLKIIL